MAAVMGGARVGACPPAAAPARRARAAVLRVALMATLVAALAPLQGCAVYNTSADDAQRDLMLQGLDPVSYFEAAAPLPGRPEFTARHKHGTYRFASIENHDKFRASPERYAPQYGAFCAKGVSYAIRAGGNPLVHEIRDGRLFIFVNHYARDYWRTDPADFIAKADRYWVSELKDAPVVWTNIARFIFRVPHYKSYPQEFADYEKRTGKPAPQRR